MVHVSLMFKHFRAIINPKFISIPEFVPYSVTRDIILTLLISVFLVLILAIRVQMEVLALIVRMGINLALRLKHVSAQRDHLSIMLYVLLYALLPLTHLHLEILLQELASFAQLIADPAQMLSFVLNAIVLLIIKLALLMFANVLQEK